MLHLLLSQCFSMCLSVSHSLLQFFLQQQWTLQMSMRRYTPNFDTVKKMRIYTFIIIIIIFIIYNICKAHYSQINVLINIYICIYE